MQKSIAYSIDTSFVFRSPLIRANLRQPAQWKKKLDETATSQISFQ
jgi:hypothetical protein